MESCFFSFHFPCCDLDVPAPALGRFVRAGGAFSPSLGMADLALPTPRGGGFVLDRIPEENGPTFDSFLEKMKVFGVSNSDWYLFSGLISPKEFGYHY